MFLIDFLIGNTDRHNGNWGILVNTRNEQAKFAPIYDCGSCLNPLLADDEMSEMSEIELKNLAINCYSCITDNEKKINYMTYIKNMSNIDCNKAILRMFEKIDIEAIYTFIDSISCMNCERKKFYKEIIQIRYKAIKKIYTNLKKF